jgi:hypothetical protein
MQLDLWMSNCDHSHGWWVAYFWNVGTVGTLVRITCAVCGYAEEMREAVFIKRFSNWEPPTKES